MNQIKEKTSLLLKTFFLLILISCSNRKVVHSGYNDMFIGSQSFILYDDCTFSIEMGAGSAEGTYIIYKNIVVLNYSDKVNTDWPKIMIIRKNYFISCDSLDSRKYLKISRLN